MILTPPCNYVSRDRYIYRQDVSKLRELFINAKFNNGAMQCHNLSLEIFYFVRRQSFTLDIYLSPSLQFNIYCRALSPLVPFPFSLYFCGKSQQWREIELRLVDRTPHLARVLSLPSPV